MSAHDPKNPKKDKAGYEDSAASVGQRTTDIINSSISELFKKFDRDIMLNICCSAISRNAEVFASMILTASEVMHRRALLKELKELEFSNPKEYQVVLNEFKFYGYRPE